MNAICFEKERSAKSSHILQEERRHLLQTINLAMKFMASHTNVLFVDSGISGTRRPRKAR